MDVGASLLKLCQDSGIASLISDPKPLIMIGIACVLLYLGIVKGYEPLLMIPIAFGMLLTNLPFGGMYHEELFAGGHANWSLFGGGILVKSADLLNLSGYTINADASVLDSLGNVFGPIIGGTLFDIEMNYPFYFATVVLAIGIGLTLVWREPKQIAAQKSPVQ